MTLKGHLDRCDREGVAGWVVDHDDANAKLQISIWHGAEFLGNCIAGNYRADLAAAGLGDGYCAFKFEAHAESISDVNSLRIEVVGSDCFFLPREGRLITGCTARGFYKRLAARVVEERGAWRRFGKCVLHIGTEKTGSTSVQTFLGLNLSALKTNGLFVPTTLAPAANADLLKQDCLAAISMADDRFDDDLRHRAHISDGHSLDEYRQNVFLNFVQEVRNAPPSCDTLILSDEHCHSRLASTEEVQSLKAFLDHFCDSYTVVVYLRPQHELAISQYGMFVANGLTDGEMLPPLPPPPGYDRVIYTNLAYFDYRALLERWADSFGQDAVKPRIFTSGDLIGGDVVSDFANSLSLELGQYTIPSKRNTNISDRGQAFLIEFYRRLKDKPRFGSGLVRERMRNAVQRCFPGPGAKPVRAQVKAFLQQFEESNEAVRARWFPQRSVLFAVELNDFPETESPVSFTATELMDIFVDVLVKDQKLLFSLTPHSLERLLKGLPPTTE